MNLGNIKEKSVCLEKLDKTVRRIRKNGAISTFYQNVADLCEEKFDDYYTERFRKKAARVYFCCQNWWYDDFETIKVRDLTSTNACGDIFCESCQSKLSQQRFHKFVPQLECFAADYDIYHIVFTVPNVSGEDLKPCVDKMYSNFAYVNRIFSGNAKIKGYDFGQYGYEGAIRALEITKNHEKNTFHPHFHCYFILKKNLNILERVETNCYSFNNVDAKKSHHKGSQTRKFSHFEILLQKIWRLRIDGEKVTKASIAALREGYSVLCERVKPGDYKEVFKYATKGCLQDCEGTFGTTTDFIALLQTLHGRKLIQGYKALRNFVFDMPIDLSADNEYKKTRAFLEFVNPDYKKSQYETLETVREHIEEKRYTYISRSSVAELLHGEDDENSK